MRMKERIAWLGQLMHLKREIDELSQRIAELEVFAQGGVGRITGMPRGGRRADRVAECAEKVIELEERMERRREDCLDTLAAVYGFIDDIPDSLTRQIFSGRYIDGMTWQQIAFHVGEYDEQVPRRIHNRYLAKFDENDEENMLK